MKTLQRRHVSSRSNSVRLRQALDAGSGHIAVFGETPSEATAFVDGFLALAARYRVARVSIRRPQATENTLLETAPDHVTVVVVDDAEAATASQLERLREVCDDRVNAAERVRLVLIGAAGLEHTLAEPDARALASRIGVRLRIAPGSAARELLQPTAKRTRRWPFAASALAAVAAVVCMAYADIYVVRPTRLAYELADRAVVLRDRAVSVLDEGARSIFRPGAGTRSGAETRPAGATKTAPAQTTSAGSPAVPSDRLPPRIQGPTTSPPAIIPSTPSSGAASTGGRGVESERENRRSSKEVRELASSPPAATGAVSASGMPGPTPTVGHRFVATVVSLFVPIQIGDRVIESGGALIESVLMAARLLARSDGHAKRPVQLGVFERPQPAFALKSTLVRDFDRVAVARFDPPAGTFYSVRVFDAETAVVASPAAVPAQTLVTAR